MSSFIPNSFQVPNAIVDEVIATLSPNSLKCYLVIIRKTVGWQKEWDKISTSQLMLLTGIKRKDTIYKAIQELEELELIECNKERGKLTSYRLVLENRTSTKKPSRPVLENRTTSSTKKPYPTKYNYLKQSKQYIALEKSEQDLFVEYLDLRTSLKLKNTDSIIDRLLKKYFEFGRNANIIEKAIVSNWKDFYNVTPSQNQNKQPQSNKRDNFDAMVDKVLGSPSSEVIEDCEVIPYEYK